VTFLSATIVQTATELRPSPRLLRKKVGRFGGIGKFHRVSIPEVCSFNSTGKKYLTKKRGKTMKNLAVLLMLVAVFTFTLTACQQSDNGGSDNQSLEGVWKIAEGKSVDANGQTASTNVQRSLVIFTEGHYSYVYTSGDEQRKLPVEHWNHTDAEKINAFNTIVVNTGTYELTESKLVFRPIAAKSEQFVGGYASHDYRLEGDSLYLEQTDVVSVDGVAIPFFSDGGREHHKLVRVQAAKPLTNK